MELINLSNAELEERLAHPAPPLLLDVRTEEEYVGLGHIPGATLIPIHELAQRLDELNPEQPTVVICEHGVRSFDASRYLLYKGFKNISHLAAGMAEWNGARAFGDDETSKEQK
jgi:rhodanese-related sulfurtransferase